MRKGWENLSPKYRQRLERNGITRQSYDAGISLKAARSHPTPTGVPIGEKRYEFLLRLAKQLNWVNRADPTTWGRTPKQAIDDELHRGTDPRWLRDRLNIRIADTKAYNGPKDPGPGRVHWLRRRQSVSIELYWYH